MRLGPRLATSARSIAERMQVFEVKRPLLVEPEPRSERKLRQGRLVPADVYAPFHQVRLVVQVEVPILRPTLVLVTVLGLDSDAVAGVRGHVPAFSGPVEERAQLVQAV